MISDSGSAHIIPMRRTKAASAASRSALILLWALTSAACQPTRQSSSLHQFSGEAMGTTYTVKLVVDSHTAPRLERLQEVARRALEDVDAKMSHYVEDSEISRLNRGPANEAFPVSAATLEVLLHAQEISDTTGGAFDITVGPLVDAWGFGPPGRPPRAPGEDVIASLLAATGWELLQVDRATSTVTKQLPGVRIDLSAIAKGFAVDLMADALEEEGARRFMVEVGGEIRTRGLNSQDKRWQIGIERPVPGDQVVDLIVPLTDLSMATSGDYRNYYEVDGRRISHTIDPRTGAPITHNVASVSVIASLCVRADAYATGLLVLGSDGYDLAEELGLAAYFLQRDKEDLFVGRMTTAFREILASGNQR